MSLRVAACFLFILFFSIYAYRNWFVSICASLVLMAFLEHPDMPKNIGGIQGLNPWNILILNVACAWWFQRRREGLDWDLPKGVHHLLILCLLVLLVGFVRLLVDLPSEFTFIAAVSELLINTVKWVIPGILLFDGCRTSSRVKLATFSFLAIYVLLAVQVIKWIPPSYAIAGSDVSARASKLTESEIGYNRVTLSMMLAGASWAILSTIVLFRTRGQQVLIFFLSALVALGQALTGGRTGYASWMVVGFLLCTLQWRRLLPVIPIAAGMVALFLPGVRNRILQGVGGQVGNIVIEQNAYEMTSGRNIAWPHVIEKIKQSPFIGYGREAMISSGVAQLLWREYGEGFPHPHQAYLQLLLDNGIIGTIPILFFYLVVLKRSVELLLDRSQPLFSAVGGVAAALVLALMIGAFGGQTFYPREGYVGMLAGIGIMFRVWVERQRSLLEGTPLFGESGEQFDGLSDSDEFSPQPA